LRKIPRDIYFVINKLKKLQKSPRWKAKGHSTWPIYCKSTFEEGSFGSGEDAMYFVLYFSSIKVMFANKVQ